MALLADLDEVDLAREVVDHLLVTAVVPPLDRVVELPARGEDPVRRAGALLRLDLREPGLLLVREVDVSLEGDGLDAEAEGVVEVLAEAVQEMVGRVVAAVDERVVAL